MFFTRTHRGLVMLHSLGSGSLRGRSQRFDWDPAGCTRRAGGREGWWPGRDPRRAWCWLGSPRWRQVAGAHKGVCISDHDADREISPHSQPSSERWSNFLGWSLATCSFLTLRPRWHGQQVLEEGWGHSPAVQQDELAAATGIYRMRWVKVIMFWYALYDLTWYCIVRIPSNAFYKYMFLVKSCKERFKVFMWNDVEKQHEKTF